jgi:hypothetical protein
MTGVQMISATMPSLYATVADLGGPGGAAQNIYIDSDPGTLGRYGERYTAAGAIGITGAALFTVSGSNSVLITKSAHGMVKGQVLDLVGFNSTAAGLQVNRPYCVVSSVSDGANFYITYPDNSTLTSSSSSGTIKYYNEGKLTNCGLPSGVVLTDCVYKTYTFQATQASAGTAVVMTCNGSPSVVIPTDYYVTNYTMTVDNANAVSVSTYIYVYSNDSVASRYDSEVTIGGLTVDAIGQKISNQKLCLKQQAGQGLSAKLWDNGGSGATYPRHFTVEITIAETFKSPA